MLVEGPDLRMTAIHINLAHQWSLMTGAGAAPPGNACDVSATPEVGNIEGLGRDNDLLLG